MNFIVFRWIQSKSAKEHDFRSIGTLSKLRRRRQREHGKTKDLIGRTIAQHVRFKTLYIS